MTNDRLLAPGELASRLTERFEASGRSGARVPIRTRKEIVEDGGIRCEVRVRLGRGDDAASKERDPRSGSGASPFLPPYDPALFVGAISPTHVCLLNKYNVVDRHLLIVTRAFAHQESPLDLDDLRAVRKCLAELDGLAFYNAGAAAGASQSHKHLQLVPCALDPGSDRFPFEGAIRSTLAAREDRADRFPFRHRIAALDRDDGGRQSWSEYRRLAAALDLDPDGDRVAPHNLLMTRDWLLLVPRSRAELGAIEVNALGFAGALLLNDDHDVERVRELGPLQVLRRVAFPS
jgi:ATP adenylyltransferase